MRRAEEQEQRFRKGASALIVNAQHEFLLVNLEAFEAQFFAIPGGGVEKGETTTDAIYRELHEELGIEKQSLELVGASAAPIRHRFRTQKLVRDGVVYDGSERWVFGFRFIGKAEEIRPMAGEVRSFQWVSYADLKEYLLFDDQLDQTVEKIAELFPHTAKETPRASTRSESAWDTTP